MNPLLTLVFVVGTALALGRGLDLGFWTDLESGLCIAGSVWLRHRFTLGGWVVAVGVVVGVLAAVSCLRGSLQALDRQGRPAKKDGKKTSPISFDRH